jgi:hypothetical protein
MNLRAALSVIPAKAGIPLFFSKAQQGTEIPAFAGMTARIQVMK